MYIILTIQVFLFRTHDFVRGGLAYCFGHGGSRYTVLGCGYPVRNALSRHLRFAHRNKRRSNARLRADSGAFNRYLISFPI